MKSVLKIAIIKVENQLEKPDGFVKLVVLPTVQSTAHQTIHFGLYPALI
jgi:hypothetical protein